jgi:hypothetical protein
MPKGRSTRWLYIDVILLKPLSVDLVFVRPPDSPHQVYAEGEELILQAPLAAHPDSKLMQATHTLSRIQASQGDGRCHTHLVCGRTVDILRVEVDRCLAERIVAVEATRLDPLRRTPVVVLVFWSPCGVAAAVVDAALRASAAGDHCPAERSLLSKRLFWTRDLTPLGSRVVCQPLSSTLFWKPVRFEGQDLLHTVEMPRLRVSLTGPAGPQ